MARTTQEPGGFAWDEDYEIRSIRTEDNPVKVPFPTPVVRLFLALAALLPVEKAVAQVVVLGQPATGAFVVVKNEAQTELKARQRAVQKNKHGGWNVLLVSAKPGWGALFCLKPAANGPVRYFMSEGEASAEVAVREARKRAYDAAESVGGWPYICGPAWNNRNLFPSNPPSSKAGKKGPLHQRIGSMGVRG